MKKKKKHPWWDFGFLDTNHRVLSESKIGQLEDFEKKHFFSGTGVRKPL